MSISGTPIAKFLGVFVNLIMYFVVSQRLDGWQWFIQELLRGYNVDTDRNSLLISFYPVVSNSS